SGKPANGAKVGGGLYYMKHVGSPTSKQYQVYGDPGLTSLVSISGGSGENHRLVPTDQAGVAKDASNRFDPGADVNYGTDKITLPYNLSADHTVNNGDAIVYTAGGGKPS